MNEILLLDASRFVWNNSKNIISFNEKEFQPMNFEIDAINLVSNLSESSVSLKVIFSKTINSSDNIAEIFMGQKVTLWKMLEDGTSASIIISGVISGFTTRTTEFFVRIQDEIFRLKEPILEKYTKKCKVAFCSSKCGVNSEDFLHKCQITQVKRASVVVEDVLPFVPFANGVATIAGENLIKSIQVRDVIADEVFFFEDVPSFVKIGDEIGILQACDKTFQTCGSYNNQMNFRGEIVTLI